MRNVRLFVLVFLAALGASGCISVTNLVKVKPNGSGTLELTFLVNTAVLKQVGGMLGGEGKVEGKSSMPSAEDLAQQLSKVQGLKLVSRTPVKRGELEGEKLLLSFDDVNQVRVNENLPDKDAKPDPKDEVRFAMTKQPGGTSLLTISFPDKPAEKAARREGEQAQETASKSPQKPSPEMLKMLSAFFKDMRMLIAVDVDGTLVRTSSPYVEGNRVTLLDVDMGQLFSNPEGIDKVSSLSLGPDTSITQLREALAKAGVTGLKVNEPKVTIEMR